MKQALSIFMLIAATGLAGSLGSTSVTAATIIDEWSSVKPEVAPELKAVTIDAKTTALLVMDIVKGGCNMQRRPRCVASIPAVAKMIGEARARGVMVINTISGAGVVDDILPEFTPKAGEVLLTGTVANKFIRTDLEKTLRAKGITTVIAVGTAAHGAVLWTSGEAAFLGFRVIVPVDGATSENLYAEQTVAWMLTNAPGVAQQVTLTKFDLMKF